MVAAVEQLQARRWMRLEEGARYVGVATITLRRWAKLGRLSLRRLSPRVVVVDAAELDEIVMQSR